MLADVFQYERRGALEGHKPGASFRDCIIKDFADSAKSDIQIEMSELLFHNASPMDAISLIPSSIQPVTPRGKRPKIDL